MKHTVKLSAFIGVIMATAILFLLKLFQPISYTHLVVFGYSFVIATVITGVLIHKNLIKRNLHNKPSYVSFLHKGKFATLHTQDGRVHRGRFQALDDLHVILDYVADISERHKIKSLMMFHKNDVKRLEVD